MSSPKVTPMQGRTGNPVTNQYTIDAGGVTYFQSYKSTVAMIVQGENEPIVTLDRDTWNYSVTTAKYLHKFLRNEGFSHWPSAREGVKSGRYLLADLNGGK